MSQGQKTGSKEKEQEGLAPVCGVVMPISAIDGCSDAHWSEVLAIVSEAIEDAGFQANLVSNADDVGIIQKRIIQNLYDNPIVVCDVSAKNANVMFELGMRLAFDKPTIIIKDDKTAYSFDTAPIEHLEYPRDLRFSRIMDFKERLTEKVKATYEKSRKDSTYTTFLKHFGEFKVAKIDHREVSGDELILDEIRAMRRQIARISDRSPASELASEPVISSKWRNRKYAAFTGQWRDDQLEEIRAKLTGLPVEVSFSPSENGSSTVSLVYPASPEMDARLQKIFSSMSSTYTHHFSNVTRP